MTAKRIYWSHVCFLDPTKNCKSCRYFGNLTNLPLHIHSQERIFQDLHRCVLGRVDKCSPVDAHDFCGVSVRVGHPFSWSVGSEQWDTCGSNSALGFWPVVAQDAPWRTAPPDCKMRSQWEDWVCVSGAYWRDATSNLSQTPQNSSSCVRVHLRMVINQVQLLYTRLWTVSVYWVITLTI